MSRMLAEVVPLAVLAPRAQPAVAAGERVLAVGGALGELLANGGVQHGAVVGIDGARGAGVTSLVLTLAAAATATGEWAAILDDGTLGAAAAAEAGVALERLAVVRPVPVARWTTVVGALLDGMTLVAAAVPPRLRPGDAHRLAARARERGAVLVAVGAWPAPAALRVHAEGTRWDGLEAGAGLLIHRHLRVCVEGRGAPVRREVAGHTAAG